MQGSSRSDPRFSDAQRSHFTEADTEQFRWTTRAPGIAESEDELLAHVIPLLRSPCLEMGCGEGNNLIRLAPSLRCVGIDMFPRKLHFASQGLPETRFAAADATKLPFPDSTFPSVFIRDLLHHVPQPANALREAVRVLQPGGRLCLLEPNGKNPLIRLQTHLVPAEIGARESGFAHIRAMLENEPLEALNIEAQQPFALRRMVLHYRLGLPVLGKSAVTARPLEWLERGLGALLPRSMWTYVVATAIKKS
jgi:SAM-dependent methyltransferase